MSEKQIGAAENPSKGKENTDDKKAHRVSGDDPHDDSGRNHAKPEKIEGDLKTPSSETGA